MNIIGTSFFISLAAALEYYTPQGESLSSVKKKVADLEISIGRPEIQPGETLIVKQGRYHIQTNSTR